MKPISLFAKQCCTVLLIAAVVVSCKKSNDPQKTASGSGKISYFVKANTALSAKMKTTATRWQIVA